MTPRKPTHKFGLPHIHKFCRRWVYNPVPVDSMDDVEANQQRINNNLDASYFCRRMNAS